MGDKKRRYCIFYIRDLDHQKLINILEKYMPEGSGEVFYPCMEYYKRGEKQVKVRPMFPGYVFLYTDLNIKEVHNLIRTHRLEINSGMRELALSQQRASDPDYLFKEGEDTDIYEISDTDQEEEEFLDFLREGNGLLTMSSGYEYVDEGESIKKYKVMDGPLKVYEDKIKSVDKHNRKAFLVFEINGKHAQAGFNCLPKAHWFPEVDSKIVKLVDGTEVDLTELKKNVMTV